MSEAEPPLSPASSLAYEDVLPLVWRVTGILSESALLRQQEENETALRMIAALEEYAPRMEEGQGEWAADFARLDFKLNCIMDLLGQLLTQQVVLPPSMPVCLRSDTLSWLTSESPPVAGTHGVVEVYVSARYPRPITFAGVISVVVAEVAGTRVQMDCQGLSELASERLEKFIFRRHRRSVAHFRRGGRVF